MTNLQDFEGYQIYYGLDDRESSLSLVASYDRQDYDKYIWNPKSGSFGAWVIKDVPFTLERLKCLYGHGTDPCHDSLFDPLRYTQSYPLRLAQFPDSQFYFVPHDFNASTFGKTTQIRKIYPNAVLPPPGATLDSTYLTPDGFWKYYEYEFTIPNLLPTMQYYVNVTALTGGIRLKVCHPWKTPRPWVCRPDMLLLIRLNLQELCLRCMSTRTRTLLMGGTGTRGLKAELLTPVMTG